jgi:serine/threonine-protein kinase RsbW
LLKPDRAIKEQSPAATPPAELALSLRHDVAAVPGLTRQVQEFLRAQGVADEKALNIRIAMAEACNNAIQYAVSDQSGEIRVSIQNGRITITITDHTPGFDLPDHSTLPETTSEHGRGLFLIREIMDRVEYLRGKTANKLIMSCNVAGG